MATDRSAPRFELGSSDASILRFHEQLFDAADLDGDGDMDFLAATDRGAIRIDAVSPTQFSSPYRFTSASAKVVRARDLDGDGRVDIAVGGAGLTGEPARLCCNGGPVVEVLSSAGIQTSWTFFEDFDLDGNLDVAIDGGTSGAVRVHLNPGGFQLATALVSAVTWVFFNDFDDVDRDGDADLLTAAYLFGSFGWYENLGDGTFGPRQVLVQNAYSISAPRGLWMWALPAQPWWTSSTLIQLPTP